MSKIPQGEWNAIAARHARGETIAKIAHDYGCTAPAIHYILKRQRERTGPAATGAADPVAPASEAAADTAANARPAAELRPAAAVRPAAEVRAAAELRPAHAEQARRDDPPAFAVRPAAAGEQRADASRFEHADMPRPEPRRAPARGSALKASLDAELQRQVEEAIEAFRANLNAALADRSPARREELRAAASDLMRMAARTMIVLDRMSAGHDRVPGPAPDYPRSAHARS
jgi:transposase-like protein